jgi:hypothetical protein
MSIQAQRMISRTFNCPAAKKYVNVQIKQNEQHRKSCPAGLQPEACSSVGECSCGVVKILFGMTYAVDWKKCKLYEEITEQ